MISYYFAGKDDLIQQVVSEIFTAISGFMTQRMEGQNSAEAALRTYIEANVAFIAANRTRMKASSTSS